MQKAAEKQKEEQIEKHTNRTRNRNSIKALEEFKEYESEVCGSCPADR
jgi:hypothetical protein